MAAALTLGRLALNEDVCQEIVTSGGIEALLASLRVDDCTLNEVVLYALRSLAASSDTEVYLMESNGMAVVLEKLKRGIGAESVAWIIEGLVKSNSANESKARQLGAVNELVGLLVCGKMGEVVAASAAFRVLAEGYIGDSFDVEQQANPYLPVVPHLLKLITTESATNSPEKRKREAGHNDDVVAALSAVFECLSRKELQALFAADGLVTTSNVATQLVSILAEQGAPSAKEQSCRCIMSFAGDTQTHKQLMAANVPQALIALLGDLTSTSKCKFYAAKLLQTLAWNAENLSGMVQKANIEALMQFLHGEDSDIYWALDALRLDGAEFNAVKVAVSVIQQWTAAAQQAHALAPLAALLKYGPRESKDEVARAFSKFASSSDAEKWLLLFDLNVLETLMQCIADGSETQSARAVCIFPATSLFCFV